MGKNSYVFWNARIPHENYREFSDPGSPGGARGAAVAPRTICPELHRARCALEFFSAINEETAAECAFGESNVSSNCETVRIHRFMQIYQFCCVLSDTKQILCLPKVFMSDNK